MQRMYSSGLHSGRCGKFSDCRNQIAEGAWSHCRRGSITVWYTAVLTISSYYCHIWNNLHALITEWYKEHYSSAVLLCRSLQWVVQCALPDGHQRGGEHSVDHHITCITCSVCRHLQWCSPRDQSLGLEVPRGQKRKSWSWSWRISLENFQDFYGLD